LEGAISVQLETAEICRHFKIDPLQLISSGALLISAEPRSADEIVRNLKLAGIQASVIGEFVENVKERVLIRRNGEQAVLPRPESDNLWKALMR
jgi:hydrogenase expression/formation protein HypE